MIVWKEKYSTGVPELDKHHRDLFRYTNDLEEVMNSDAVSKKTVDGIMLLLGQYIKVHFSHEETCMHKYLCPMAAKNKDAHQKFIRKFKAVEKKIGNEGATDTILKELHHFLETWLVEHICKIDTRLKPCVH